jgi:pimeloyl-ACP methyl ester carboxylesterase
MERYVERLLEPGALTAALNWYRALGAAWAMDMGPVTAPTMFVWSTDDPAVGREAAEACGRYVEGPYRFEVLEGVGHWIPEEAAAELNRLLLEHLSPASGDTNPQ